MKKIVRCLQILIICLGISTSLVLATNESDEYEKAKKVAQSDGLELIKVLCQDQGSEYYNSNAEDLTVLDGYQIHQIDYSLCTSEVTTFEQVEKSSDGVEYIFPTAIKDEGQVLILVWDNMGKGEMSLIGDGGKAGPFVQAVNIISKLQKKDSSIEVSLYTNKEGYDAIFVLTTSDGEYCLPAYGTGLDSSYLEVSDYHQLPTAQTMIAAINEEYLKAKAELDATPCPVGVNCYGEDVKVMPVVTASAPAKTTNYLPYYVIGGSLIIAISLVLFIRYRKKRSNSY